MGESLPTIRVRITVTLKAGVLDPQGKAIEGALAALGFDGIRQVRQGKVFDLEFADDDPQAAEVRANAVCERLLANTVIEDYAVELVAS